MPPSHFEDTPPGLFSLTTRRADDATFSHSFSEADEAVEGALIGGAPDLDDGV